MATSDSLVSSLQDISSTTFTNEAERVKARDALFEALRRVQSPWDIVWDHNWVTGATNAAVKTLIDAGLFKEWAKIGGKQQSSKELADLVGADVVLIRRLIRQISGQCLLTEIAEDTYAPTPWSSALASDPALSSVYGEFYAQLNNPMFSKLPYFLASQKYQNPTDVNASNWQFTKGTPNNLFQDMAINPEMARDFHFAMQCHSKYNLTPWTEVFPTDTIVSDAKEDRALVVDIGGSKGHDLEKFLAKHPDVKEGSLILQDLPDVVQDVKFASPAITAQPYDLFKPQNILGAKAYFMHNVLHDWTDDLAITALKNVAAAMEKGYSKVLVHESLISSVKPLARVTTSDLTVMACLSAKERTEDEFKRIFESAGLRVVKIWRPVQSVESIIEAEL